MAADTLIDRIEEVIARKIRPVLQADRGDIALQEMTPEGFVKVRLTGACATCPGAANTVSDFISAELMSACPEVKGVVQGNQVSDALIDQALKILRRSR